MPPWEYSDFQDILDIYLEPDARNLVYEEIEGQEGISRALEFPDARLAGISAECVSRRLNSDRPTDAQLGALAETPRHAVCASRPDAGPNLSIPTIIKTILPLYLLALRTPSTSRSVHAGPSAPTSTSCATRVCRDASV